jgi:DNA repair protein RadD
MRLKTMELPPADIVIVDEGHHGRARTYEEIIAAYPCRADGRGLGNIFQTIVEGPQIAEPIELERLVKPKIYAPAAPDLRGVETASTGDYVISQLSERMNTDVLTGDVVEHYLRHGQRRRAVCFTVDVAHSIHLTREFVNSGIKAEHLDGMTKQDEREAILARLASGETEVVCNCAVLTEGFDLPELACIILVRPTKSLLLFRQMIGRGLRTAPGKDSCIILDHAGAVHRHGLPTDKIEWTLTTDQRAANKAHESRKRENSGDPFCKCNQCGANRTKGFACTECGYQPKPRGERVDYVDDDLVELGRTQRTEIDRLQFFRELCGHQKTFRRRDGSSYKPTWPACQFKDKYGAWPPRNWNAYTPLPPSDATNRWIKSRQIAWAKRMSA